MIYIVVPRKPLGRGLLGPIREGSTLQVEPKCRNYEVAAMAVERLLSTLAPIDKNESRQT